jgi:hypothetical protein
MIHPICSIYVVYETIIIKNKYISINTYIQRKTSNHQLVNIILSDLSYLSILTQQI